MLWRGFEALSQYLVWPAVTAAALRPMLLHQSSENLNILRNPIDSCQCWECFDALFYPTSCELGSAAVTLAGVAMDKSEVLPALPWRDPQGGHLSSTSAATFPKPGGTDLQADGINGVFGCPRLGTGACSGARGARSGL